MGVGEWTRGPAIGRGSSGTVSLAVDRQTGDVFAVKSVGADRAAELRREQSILCGLSSPYVVRCLGSDVPVAEDLGGYHMFMEYAPGGSLADEIKLCGGRCAEDLIRSRARDILRGLAHVHASGVAHCDVKGRNVLIGSDGRAIIADFGCARRVAGYGGGIAERRASGGTPVFMAPETARGDEQGPAADIWALGCTVIEMATGSAPWQRFSNPAAVLHHLAFSGQVPEFPCWLSDQGKDFLARCLQQDHRERWTAEQLLEHEYVSAAAASNLLPRITNKKMFVSPKSVLDQALWDDTAAEDIDATAGPTDRVRALASGAPVVPDWTWNANWITVHSSSSDEVEELEMSPEPEVETDTDSDSLLGNSAGRASNSRASHADADGDSYDDASSCNGEGSDASFFGGNHVISDGNPAITGNGFFPISSAAVTFFFFCPSWPLLFTFLMLLFTPSIPTPTNYDKLTERECQLTTTRWSNAHEAKDVGILFWSCVPRDSQLAGGYTVR